MPRLKRKSPPVETNGEAEVETPKQKKRTKRSATSADSVTAYLFNMPLTSTQNAAIRSFVSFTNSDKKKAERILRQYNWNVEQAVNSYYNGGAAPSPQNSNSKAALEKVFDSLRDAPKEQPNEIGPNGALEYFGKIGVDPTGIDMFIISELLHCPSMGTISRKGFVDGWSTTGDDTVQKQSARIPTLIKNMQSDRSHYNRVYKYAFPLVKEDQKRAVDLEEAVEYWKILFAGETSPVKWTSSSVAWLDLWIEFLQTEWKKTVNKDMWDQLLKFADETLKHGSLDFWSEESAWPGVIDEFVAFCNEKLGTKKGSAENDEMEY